MTVETYGQRGLDLQQQITEAKTYPPYILGGDAKEKGVLWVGPEKFESGVKLAVDAGLISSAINVGALVDQSLLRAANA